MAAGFVCWKCGASLADLPMSLARVAECRACRADLHVCRLCEYYDIRSAKECREPVADEVQDKGRANFCGYFQAKAGAYSGQGNAISQHARGQLDALFGGGSGELEKKVSRTDVDVARERLEQLFGSGGKGGV